MDCFGDICLSCEQPTAGTTFCSQACRLRELDHYTQEPSSPTSYSISILQSSYTRRSISPIMTTFYLPPAFDFSLYRSPSSQSISTSTSTRSSPSTPGRRLSEQARVSLNNYVGYFDQTRTLKRQPSVQSTHSIEDNSMRSRL